MCCADSAFEKQIVKAQRLGAPAAVRSCPFSTRENKLTHRSVYCPGTKVSVCMDVGINKQKGYMGGETAYLSNLKRINLALQGGGSHGAFA
jgi:hypothetical protein